MKTFHASGIGTLMYLTAIEAMTNNIVVMKQVHGLCRSPPEVTLTLNRLSYHTDYHITLDCISHHSLH